MRLFLDYETYYDSKTYTLRKMTPVEYILDKRFQVHGCAVQEGLDGVGFWLKHEELPKYFKTLDPKETVVLTYNALFDMCITEWIYGFDPILMIDVLGMARRLRGYLYKSMSLANMAHALGLPDKGDAIIKVDGLSTEEIEARALMPHLASYAIRDNALCSAIYQNLQPEFPQNEIRIMDLVLRCAVQPQLRLNRRKLVMHRRLLRTQKAKMLRDCAVDRVDLMSAARFKGLLEAAGVIVELKMSPTAVDKVTGKPKMIPALAKTDEFMAELLEHPDKKVAALAAARLGHKSTLEETRAARFASIAKLTPPPFFYRAGSAPIALRYGAAHTGRLGGEWKLNFQNLTRGGVLRYAIEALTLGSDGVPGEEDEVVMAPDYSQIEARMVAFLARCMSLLETFARRGDPYSQLASAIFGRPINRKLPGDKIEGFIGKTGILGLGYGAGAEKFHLMVHQLARAQLGHDIEFTLQQAVEAVGTYRNKMYPEIPRLWRTFDNILPEMATTAPGSKVPRSDVYKTMFPMLEFEGEAIVLPNGMRIHYHDLRDDCGQWTYRYGREERTIYGAKVAENVSQALAGIIAMNAALRVNDKFKMRLALQAHDELVFPVKKSLIPVAVQNLTTEMTRRPWWGKELPLAIEVKHGATYGDAK